MFVFHAFYHQQVMNVTGSHASPLTLKGSPWSKAQKRTCLKGQLLIPDITLLQTVQPSCMPLCSVPTVYYTQIEFDCSMPCSGFFQTKITIFQLKGYILGILFRIKNKIKFFLSVVVSKGLITRSV